MRGRLRSTTLIGSVLTIMTVVSLAVVGSVLDRFVREELGRQAEEGNRALATSVAHEIFSFLDVHFSALSLLGNPAFGGSEAAEALGRGFPAFESVLLADRTGKVVVASSVSGEFGFDLRSRDYFRVPIETGADFVSPPFISGARYNPSSVLARPVSSGVAMAYVSLLFMSEYLSSLPAGGDKTIAVVDARGVYIAHSVDSSIGNRGEIVSLEPWFRTRDVSAGTGVSTVFRKGGSEELLCWARVPGVSNWTVIVSEPTGTVFMAARFLRLILTVVLLVYSLISFAMIWGVIRLVRGDLETLIRFSQGIADGIWDEIFRFRGFRDFTRLAVNMERMGASIRERETLLRTNERRLFDLLDFLPIPALVLDRESRIELANRALTRTLGWTREDIPTEDSWFKAIYPDPGYRELVRGYWHSYCATLAAGQSRPDPFKGNLACKDGSFRTVVGEAALLADRTVVTFFDITEADENARKMAASLAEKEVLLKEVHHRVKNNLQIVISLLSLNASSNPETEHAISDSISRIRVMADIHQLLYRSRDLSRIDMGEYCEKLAAWLLSTPVSETASPRIDIRVEPMELGIDKAIPCGLIINEILTNSIKYAFRGEIADPCISISGSRALDGRITLELSDNGIGLPHGFEPNRMESLGMQLIVSLCDQIHANWSLDGGPGTRWTISFME